jgi:hypothetical protein
MSVAGQTFQFRSMDDMLKGLAYFRRELAALTGNSSTRYAATSKGV